MGGVENNNKGSELAKCFDCGKFAKSGGELRENRRRCGFYYATGCEQWLVFGWSSSASRTRLVGWCGPRLVLGRGAILARFRFVVRCGTEQLVCSWRRATTESAVGHSMALAMDWQRSRWWWSASRLLGFVLLGRWKFKWQFSVTRLRCATHLHGKRINKISHMEKKCDGMDGYDRRRKNSASVEVDGEVTGRPSIMYAASYG